MADCKRRSAVWQFFARHDIGFKKLASRRNKTER
jgi:hypothetical protein